MDLQRLTIGQMAQLNHISEQTLRLYDKEGLLKAQEVDLKSGIPLLSHSAVRETTRCTVVELEDIFTICAKNGVNAITTCEEALYPWNSSPALTAKLDALAKEGGCTLTGVGYCDLFWGTMVTNLMGSSFEVKKITGSSWYDVEDYGIALAEVISSLPGLSLTPPVPAAPFGYPRCRPPFS